MSTTTITLTSSSDSITFSGDDVASGFIYDNAALDSWFVPPGTRLDTSPRSAQHGDFNIDQIFTEGARPSIPGQFYSNDATGTAAAIARNRLAGLFNDGKPVTMSVTDPLGTTTRSCLVTNVDAPWAPWMQFTFAIDLYAADPRRYGPVQNYGPTSNGAASSGLVWPLGTAPSGRFFDWGTPSNAGSLIITNTGNTVAYPTMIVAGAYNSGFRVSESESGRELIYSTAVSANNPVILNNLTKRATIAGNDVTENLTSRKWFSIPPGKSRTYYLNSIGSSSSATLSATFNPAYL